MCNALNYGALTPFIAGALRLPQKSCELLGVAAVQIQEGGPKEDRKVEPSKATNSWFGR